MRDGLDGEGRIGARSQTQIANETRVRRVVDDVGRQGPRLSRGDEAEVERGRLDGKIAGRGRDARAGRGDLEQGRQNGVVGDGDRAGKGARAGGREGDLHQEFVPGPVAPDRDASDDPR